MALPKGTKRIQGTYVEDIQGNKYGLLTAIEFVEITKSRAYWLCECECGTKVVKMAKLLKNGHTTTCGDISHHTKHGQSKSRLFSIWQDMKNRCNNSNLKNYTRYGGRGIKVCVEWMTSFESFRAWALLNGYTDKLTIDRKDVDGSYEPSNCRWATMVEQGNNRSVCNYLTLNGTTKTVTEWGRQYGISGKLISSRIKAGWAEDKLLTPPDVNRKRTNGRKSNEDIAQC